MKDWDKIEQEMKELAADMPEQNNMEKQINASINKRIRRIAGQVVAGVLTAAVVLFCMVSPLLNMGYLNPAKLNQEPESELLVTLRDYYETTRPYAEVIGVDVEKEGFARYGLAIQVSNHREPVRLGMKNVWVDVVRGEYRNWVDPNQRLVYTMNRFDMETGKAEKSELLDSVRELPESVRLYLSIGEQSAKSLEALRKEAVTLEWLQVYQPDVEFQGGMNMRMQALIRESDDRAEMTETKLKEVYLSHLENLIAHPEVWKPLDLSSGNTLFVSDETGLLKECYESAKNLKTIETKNYCISGKRDEILAYLEQLYEASIYVDAVKLSEFPQE